MFYIILASYPRRSQLEDGGFNIPLSASLCFFPRDISKTDAAV